MTRFQKNGPIHYLYKEASSDQANLFNHKCNIRFFSNKAVSRWEDHGPSGAIEAEAKAVEVGLQFAKDLSIQDFTLEIDSQVLINALTETSPAPASVAAIVHSVIADSHSSRQVEISPMFLDRTIGQLILLAKHALGIANCWCKHNNNGNNTKRNCVQAQSSTRKNTNGYGNYSEWAVK